ncbi:MAG: hypothetical protein QXS81_04800 [Candidatus Micrarchaeaceae archaeon]
MAKETSSKIPIVRYTPLIAMMANPNCASKVSFAISTLAIAGPTSADLITLFTLQKLIVI